MNRIRFGWLILTLGFVPVSLFAAEPRDFSRYRNLQVGDGGYFGPYHHYPVAAPPGRGFTSNLGVGVGPSYIEGLGTGSARTSPEPTPERPATRFRFRAR